MSYVILEFTGSTDGAQIFRHPLTNRSIRAGRNLAVRYVSVTPEEVAYLISLGLFRVAHNNNNTNNTQSAIRRDAPKRIEPVFQQPVEESKAATAVSNPTETIVSFGDAEIDSSISWMNADSAPQVAADPVEEKSEEVTEEVTEEVVEEISDTQVSASEKKTQRGRPKS
jgi:hypothetical protein